MGWPMMPVPINPILAMIKILLLLDGQACLGSAKHRRSTVGAGLPAMASTGYAGDTAVSASQASQLPHCSVVCLLDGVVGFEPAKACFGGGQRLVFAANPTRITDAVQMLEQEAVVDLTGPRLVAARVVGQLDVVDFTQVRSHGPSQVTFHDLHVVDVVLQEQVGAAHLLANRQG